MVQARLYQNAFWFYGIIVGLAIREALTKVGPHVIGSSPVEAWQRNLEIWRLILFLLTIIRFYLGSVYYFGRIHFDEGANNTDRSSYKSSYGLDFLLGLVHFLIIFFWSMTIVEHSVAISGLSLFLLLLALILSYDVIWLFSNKIAGLDSVHEIKLWTVVNILSLAFGALFYLAGEKCTDNNLVTSEMIALIPIALIGLVDIAEIISKRKFITGFFEGLVSRHRSAEKKE